uniref:Uncharacterized protein n=1 Tax=Biomphalaria glabrata TaxID=6526 RepID=A0A2C9LWW9_BIOGL
MLSPPIDFAKFFRLCLMSHIMVTEATGRINLMEQENGEESYRCLDSHNDTIQYEHRGLFNISDIDQKTILTIGCEICYNNLTLSRIVDYVKSFEECFNDTNVFVYCKQTSDDNIIEVVINTSLKLADSSQYLRVVMFISDEGKEYSQNVTLPKIVNQDMDFQFTLKVNNVTVSMETLAIEVTKENISILYQPISTPSIASRLILLTGNGVLEIPENITQHLSFKSCEEDILWTFLYCNKTRRNGTISLQSQKDTCLQSSTTEIEMIKITVICIVVIVVVIISSTRFGKKLINKENILICLCSIQKQLLGNKENNNRVTRKEKDKNTIKDCENDYTAEEHDILLSCQPNLSSTMNASQNDEV